MFKLPPLPYALDALEPFLSEDTLYYHYFKHNSNYIKELNNLIKDTKYEKMNLEMIIKLSTGKIFNNAAQAWNHTFYWHSLSPIGGGQPDGALLDSIKNSFSNFDSFKNEFSEKAESLFGSGWTWLIKDNNKKLYILNTKDAETPITKGLDPLLVCDVWEHAYYLDYKNRRDKYLDYFWHIVDWDFVSNNFNNEIIIQD